MRKWIIHYRQNPGVKLWLEQHPPAEGSPMEHAYKHMPTWCVSKLGMKARDVMKRRKELAL